MSEWAIVAIPEDSSEVWKLSSEKVPHLTLLYFGEQDDPEKALHISTYLQHAVNTSLNKFSLGVRNRGVLGDESADVLFFKVDGEIKHLVDFRSFLLGDSVIKDAYNSTKQYDGWTPHLTLGYPSKPAKTVPNQTMNNIYNVYFDKVALWVNNYEGPTFDLFYRDEYAMAQDTIAHRQAKVAEMHKKPETPRDVVMRNVLARKQLREPSNLKHHSIGARKVSYKNPLEDALRRTLPMASASSKQINKEGRFIKEIVSGSLQHGSSTETKKIYVRENQLAFIRDLVHSVGGRPSEREGREFDLATLDNGDWALSSIDRLAHTGTVEYKIHPVIDDHGLILKYELSHDQLTDDDMRYALKHYGVKGMKWGVRRRSPDSDGGGSSKSGGASSKSGGGGTGSGGGVVGGSPKAGGASNKFRESRERRAEAKRASRSDDANNAIDLKQKLKKSKSSSMSNQEMQQLITRLQLESQLSNAMVKNPKAKSEGRKFVESLVVDTAKVAIKSAVQEAASREAKKFLNSQIEEARNRRSSSS